MSPFIKGGFRGILGFTLKPAATRILFMGFCKHKFITYPRFALFKNAKRRFSFRIIPKRQIGNVKIICSYFLNIINDIRAE